MLDVEKFRKQAIISRVASERKVKDCITSKLIEWRNEIIKNNSLKNR